MDVRAAMAGCVTAADHYRVQIEAENLLTPVEIADLLADAPSLPEPGRVWVEKLASLGRRIRPETQPYRRRMLSANAMVFEGAGPTDAPRSLVIGFTGVAMRMMMPTPPFLQGLPAERCDVVLLRDPGRVAFLDGVPGYAPDLVALAARLEADLPLSRHPDRVCIGTSSGGAAALAFAPLIGARVALSLGGMHPRGMVLRAAAAGIDRYAFDRLRDAAPLGATRLVCVHGEDFIRDSVRSRLLAMMVPGSEVLAVRGVALHGVLGGLALRNAMGRFLEEVLLDGRLPADGVWQP